MRYSKRTLVVLVFVVIAVGPAPGRSFTEIIEDRSLDKTNLHPKPLHDSSLAGPWYVAETGSDLTGDGSLGNPFETIQHAINAAGAGEEVITLPGTFRGTGNRDIDFLGKAITVRSLNNDPAECIIDCQGSAADPHRGFIFHSAEDSLSLLLNLTITGGGGHDYGGGILVGSAVDMVADWAAPRIRGCVLMGNEADNGAGMAVFAAALVDSCCVTDNSGSGVYTSYSSLATFSSCDISRNTASGIIMEGNVDGELNVGFTDCLVADNGGQGVDLGGPTGYVHPEFVDCRVEDNSGWGYRYSVGEDLLATISGGSVSRNGSGGLHLQGGGDGTLLQDVLVEGNLGPGMELGFTDLWDIRNCVVRDNRGHGISFGVGAKVKFPSSVAGPGAETVFDCEITLNDGRGIDFQLVSIPVYVEECLITDNGLEGIGVDAPLIPFSGGELIVSSCTIAANGAAGLSHSTNLPCTVQSTIISNNLGQAVECSGLETPQLGCTDVWGNSGGDWVGCIAPQSGSADNLEADPLFCGMANAPELFSLREDSPCLAANNVPCGLVGARDYGCTTAEFFAPVITSISDVGNDQGRWVRLIWNRSSLDDQGSPVAITGYGVYRRQDAFKAESDRGSPNDKLAGWDYLLDVPARGDQVYQTVVPTLCDSTIAKGPCWSFFMVSAMTDDPLVFFDSKVDSGYSLDNLNPEDPANFAVVYEFDHNTLQWDESESPDFSHFLIYRVEHGAGIPRFGDPYHDSVITTSWEDRFDGGAKGAWDYDYFLAAVDFSGNPSGIVFPSVSPVGFSLPVRTALHANVPNPFNPRTTISFELSRPGNTLMRIYDISGRLVATLIDGEVLEPGPHQVVWNGRNSRGQGVAAGVYFYHLESGGFNATRRMVLLK